MEEVRVVIVGAGPSGLATAACLASKGIPYVILEREDCCGSLWKKNSYDRLSLHLAKSFCSLPHKPHNSCTPTFMSKHDFSSYLDSYVKDFNINPRYNRSVELAFYDETSKKWSLEARTHGEKEVYLAENLVVATGENGEAFIPEISGLETFQGEVIHSSKYKNGEYYEGKKVLVVGSGNSGMEISNDLSEFGVHTFIVIRSPFHILSKRMVLVGMLLLQQMKMKDVDNIMTKIEKYCYGDLRQYGIHRPRKGPFELKASGGRTPVIDGGITTKISSQQVKAVPEIKNIKGNDVEFVNGDQHSFDAIILATGYTSGATNWLKDYKYALNEKGLPKRDYPEHWKGEKGLYCVGMTGRGLPGISADAKLVAEDIYQKLNVDRKKKAVVKNRFRIPLQL